MRCFSIVGLGLVLSAASAQGQCNESYMRVRDDVPADTGLGVGQGERGVVGSDEGRELLRRRERSW